MVLLMKVWVVVYNYGLINEDVGVFRSLDEARRGFKEYTGLHAPVSDIFTWSIKSSVIIRKQYRIKPQILSGSLRGGIKRLGIGSIRNIMGNVIFLNAKLGK